jgi:platelet-activating factor acetylhydrolase
MTDESILETEILDEMPDEHRPNDEWIAARLRVDHEFKKRVAAGVQRKFKRNFQGVVGTGHTTSDEVWSHFKPTSEQLDKWINEEGRGEVRIDEQAALKGDGGEIANSSANDAASASKDDETTLRSEADGEQQSEGAEAKTASQSDQELVSRSGGDLSYDGTEESRPAGRPAGTEADTSSDAPPGTWLGLLPALKGGPQQR